MRPGPPPQWSACWRCRARSPSTSARSRRCGAEPIEVRTPAELDERRRLVMPGGESTTMSMLLERSGLLDRSPSASPTGMPTFGTCAGMILLGREILDGRPDQRCFGAVDIAGAPQRATAARSTRFEADLDVAGIEASRRSARSSSGRRSIERGRRRRRGARRRSTADPVLLPRAYDHSSATFHPELSGDPRLHRLLPRDVRRRCPAIPSGPRSSTRRAPPTRPAASSSPS